MLWLLYTYRNSQTQKKFGNTVAGKEGPEKKQRSCVLMMRQGMGWHSREIKLKELKHEEGHITLGKWNSQWSHMQPYVGWALLFASVTCFQGYIRWDLFVLGAQSLDTSPLALCQHNKTLLPTKLPQCPVFQLVISWNITWGLAGIVVTVSYHFPCHQSASPGPLGGDPTRCQWTARSGGGFILLASRGEGLGCTMEPSEAQEPTWEYHSSDW
jgi:hypothetical protein